MKRIGITLGDINGIGPEVTLKAISALTPGQAEVVLIGPQLALYDQAHALDLPIPGTVWNTKQQADWEPGQATIEASLAAAEAIRLAVEGCQSGALDAMVTAPICKAGFAAAGIQVPGHTELLAELTGTTRFGMMLVGGGLRVMLVTRHLPLAAVPSALTQKNILEAMELTGEALVQMDLPEGRIGVCGLNPHAGDAGTLGREEINLISPAIEKARVLGLNVAGPIPADTIFYQAHKGEFDAVVAMYHDQGLGPLKMVGFDEGINITLGLPIIRTSPDHGTAFGIAGKNDASPKSMQHAIKLAVELATRKGEQE